MADKPVQVDADSWGFPRVPPPGELCRHAERHNHALEAGSARPSSTQAWPANSAMQGGCSVHHGISGTAPSPPLSSGKATGDVTASDQKAAEAVHGAVGAAGQRGAPYPLGVGDAHEGRQEQTERPGPLLHTAFLDALDSSRAFRSPHCEGEQAKTLGAQARTARLPCLALFGITAAWFLFCLIMTWAGVLGWASGLSCAAMGPRGSGRVPEGSLEAKNQPGLVVRSPEMRSGMC